MPDYLRNPNVAIEVKDQLRLLFRDNNPTPDKERMILKKKPLTILIADSFRAAQEIKRLRITEGVAPYAITGLWLTDAFLGRFGPEVQDYMYRMLKIALGHNESIVKIEIVLSRVELSCKTNSWEDVSEIEKKIRKLAGKRQIEIISQLREDNIDYGQYTDVLFHCMDFRWTKRNVKDFTSDGKNPVVFGFAGSGAVLLARLGSDLQSYVLRQVVFVHKLLTIKRNRVVNHGDGCGGYDACGKNDSASQNDLKKLKKFLTTVFAACGLYGVDFEVYFKTEYKGAIDMEKGWIEEKDMSS